MELALYIDSLAPDYKYFLRRMEISFEGGTAPRRPLDRKWSLG
jgi:hypothetical protein